MPHPAPENSLSDLLQENPHSPVWAVDLTRQQIHRHLGNGNWDSAPVSTSRFGIGSEPDSNKTPVGWHQIVKVIGVGGPTDQEYISREPVPASTREDRILSRILWLDGLEPGVNRTSRDRYIYIHGTNHTDLLGTPESMGCVRMDPDTIADWADQCGDAKPKVWIGELG